MFKSKLAARLFLTCQSDGDGDGDGDGGGESQTHNAAFTVFISPTFTLYILAPGGGENVFLFFFFCTF